MKEHVQEYGVRRWAGDDLVELQGEPLEAIQKLVEPYAPCIIQGCEVNAAEKRIGSGMVALWEVDENNQKKGVKIARFAGCVTEKFPVYLSLKRTPEERVYVDGKNKPIAHNYMAQETTVENDVKDKFPLKITEDGGPRLPESLTVNFTTATTRENIQPKETLGTAFGKIRKWFSDLKAHAFRAIVKDDLAETLRNELDGKAAGNHTHTPASLGAAATSHSHADASISTAGFMSADDKKKMNLLSNHQQVFASYAVRLASHGTYGFISVGDKWVSNNYGVDKGVAETTWKIYSLSAQTVTFKYRVISEAGCDKLTITVNGTVAVNAVSGKGNETALSITLNAGENTLVAKYAKDGSVNTNFDCAYIRFGNVENMATQSEQGLMSAADKTKLDGIATGADKTIVDTALDSTSEKPVQNKVIKKALDDKLSLSGGTMTGPIVYSSSSGNKTTNYISAGGGYGTGTGKNGLKLLWNWDSGGQAGVGVNLTGYQHETTFAAHQDRNGLCYFTFAKHAADSSSYTRLAEIDKDGNFNTTGVVKENGTRVYSPNNKPPLATTSANGLMSAADKKKVDGAYIYYMARIECPTTNATAKEVYNPAGVIASFKIEKNVNGVYVCKTSIGRPAGYTYAKVMILGESNGPAHVDGDSGTGNFNVYITHNNDSGKIIGATFVLVMIAHN